MFSSKCLVCLFAVMLTQYTSTSAAESHAIQLNNVNFCRLFHPRALIFSGQIQTSFAKRFSAYGSHHVQYHWFLHNGDQSDNRRAGGVNADTFCSIIKETWSSGLVYGFTPVLQFDSINANR